jgi:hypothetical protein
MQQQQQPGGPVPTYRNVQGVRTEPPNQRTTYNVQRTTYGTYSVLSIPAQNASSLMSRMPYMQGSCLVGTVPVLHDKLLLSCSG